MSSNNIETNTSQINKKRNDPNSGYINVNPEIGFPNNKDKSKGKKGGIVGKE